MNYASNHKLLKPQVLQLFLVPFDSEPSNKQSFQPEINSSSTSLTQAQQMLALLEKTKASSIDEFIQNELKLDGVPPELIRLGIERLLQDSPLKYKFDRWNSNQN
nr:hypothetical protein [Nostoc sp. EkiNYC01]